MLITFDFYPNDYPAGDPAAEIAFTLIEEAPNCYRADATLTARGSAAKLDGDDYEDVIEIGEQLERLIGFYIDDPRGVVDFGGDYD